MARSRGSARRWLPVVAGLLVVNAALILGRGNLRKPDPAAEPVPEPPITRNALLEPGPIRCTVKPLWNPWYAYRFPDVRVELLNTSAKRFTFGYHPTPLGNVSFSVKDRDGTSLGSFSFASFSSEVVRSMGIDRTPTPPKTHTLEPGEAYTADLNLWILEEYIHGPDRPGRYTLEASFPYANFANWEAPGPFYESHSAAVPLNVGARPWGPDSRWKWRLLPPDSRESDGRVTPARS
jgi:hypothetical protein